MVMTKKKEEMKEMAKKGRPKIKKVKSDQKALGKGEKVPVRSMKAEAHEKKEMKHLKALEKMHKHLGAHLEKHGNHKKHHRNKKGK